MKIPLSLLLLFTMSLARSQNTAVSSGIWSSCATWGHPAAIYRNTTDTKTINSGVTVTADAAWSTAALALNGSGAVALNSGIFLDFVNDQGADVSCDAVYAALQSAGCASCAAYNSAVSGRYVPITEGEYNAIRTQLSAITLAGASDGQLNFNSGAVSGTSETRSIAGSHTKAPANSYVVAFAVSVNAPAGFFPGSNLLIKLKYNTTASPMTGYADYGSGYYGIITIPTSGKFYFLMKNPSQQTYSGGDSYLAYYASPGGIRIEGSDTEYSAHMADANTLSVATFDYRPCFQVITTTVKQW